MDGKCFSDETKDLIVKVGDEAIKAGVIGELVDGLGVRGLINIVDHYADKVIPDEFDSSINQVATLALNGDYVESIEVAEDVLTDLADLKIENPTVEIIVKSGISLLVGLLKDYIEKKKEG